MSIIPSKSSSIENGDLDSVYFTGAGFTRKQFKGISRESQLGYYETVWAASLNRDNTFALNNIDDIDIGKVARLNLVFPIMLMSDFLILQQLLTQRHIIVDYFNVDVGHRVTEEMAITGNERKKLYVYGNSLVGMRDVTLSLVGTNRGIEKNKITITYNSNGGVGEVSPITTSYSNQVTIDSGSNLTNGSKHLKHWNTQANGLGKTYLPNLSLTVYENLDLYAIWE